MLLTPFNIFHYLQDRGLVTIDEFINNHYSVELSHSRNNNFIVNKNSKKAYFIKQPKQLLASHTQSLKTEATCYWIASNEEDYDFLKPCIPEYVNYDSLNHILIVKYYKNTIPINKELIQNENISLHLGKLLGSYHNKREILEHPNMKTIFPSEMPYIFKMGDPYFIRNWIPSSDAESHMVELIQKDEIFMKLIKECRKEWKVNGLIHGDIKETNFLLMKEDSDTRIILLDWELASFGDSNWDVAAVFRMYLNSWIHSLSNNSDNSDNILNDVQYHINSVWNSYCSNLDLSPEEDLLKVIKYCALGLVQNCFEASSKQDYLPQFAVQALQIGFNILKNPLEAQKELFGFSIEKQTHERLIHATT